MSNTIFKNIPTIDSHGTKPILPIKAGFEVDTNEAGSSYSLKAWYKDFLEGGAGFIWFLDQPHPFINFLLTPSKSIYKDYLKIGYIGNAAFTNINSWFYTSQGFDLTSQFSLSKDFKVGLATLLQGAMSYPKYDDLYAKWVSGINATVFGELQFYALLTSYFAASKTPMTSWALDYAPRYQDIKVGANWMQNPKTVYSVFADFDKIQRYMGFSAARNIYSAGDILTQISGTFGFSDWNRPFFNDPNFFIFANITVTIDDNSNDEEKIVEGTRYTFNYENRNLGNTPSFTLWSIGNLPKDDESKIADARQHVISSNSFSDLTSEYSGKSAEDALAAANLFGQTLAEVGYNYDAFDKLMGMEYFDPVVKEMSEKSYEDIFYYLKQYIQYYNTHGTYEGMPEDLKKGIVICGGIHEFMAEFLRQNGIDAYTMTANTKETAHFVTLAFYEGKTSVLDYGARYTTNSGSLAEGIRLYQKQAGVPTFQSQIFKKGKYFATFTTADGLLLHRTLGSDTNKTMEKVLEIWNLK